MKVKLPIRGHEINIYFLKHHRLVPREKKSKKADYDVIDTTCHVDLEKFHCDTYVRQNPADKYDKIFGKKIALLRALDLLHLVKLDRKAIWDAFIKTYIVVRQKEEING